MIIILLIFLRYDSSVYGSENSILDFKIVGSIKKIKPIIELTSLVSSIVDMFIFIQFWLKSNWLAVIMISVKGNNKVTMLVCLAQILDKNVYGIF